MTAHFAISFQAYYQRCSESEPTAVRFREEVVIELVANIRRRQPNIGTRKLLHLLRDDCKRLDYRLGRDALGALLRREHMLVKRRKTRPYTTLSAHALRTHPNLLERMQVRRVGQALVSDITYLRLSESFCYLFLVTDLASRMVVGWELAVTLDIQPALAALRRAVKVAPSGRGSVHHSDRGVQYCSKDYVRAVLAAGFRVSMGRVGAPQDNSVAERVNGILKCELLLEQTFASFALAYTATRETIQIYNEERPHLSLDMETPACRFQKMLNRRRTYRSSVTHSRPQRSRELRNSLAVDGYG